MLSNSYWIKCNSRALHEFVIITIRHIKKKCSMSLYLILRSKTTLVCKPSVQLLWQGLLRFDKHRLSWRITQLSIGFLQMNLWNPQWKYVDTAQYATKAHICSCDGMHSHEGIFIHTKISRRSLFTSLQHVLSDVQELLAKFGNIKRLTSYKLHPQNPHKKKSDVSIGCMLLKSMGISY